MNLLIKILEIGATINFLSLRKILIMIESCKNTPRVLLNHYRNITLYSFV